MDSKIIEYFRIPNDTISYPTYTIESVPALYNGTDIIRWTAHVKPDSLYRLDLTPNSGSGTFANPWILSQSEIVLPASDIPANAARHYTLQYYRDWKVLLIPASYVGGYWALKF